MCCCRDVGKLKLLLFPLREGDEAEEGGPAAFLLEESSLMCSLGVLIDISLSKHLYAPTDKGEEKAEENPSMRAGEDENQKKLKSAPAGSKQHVHVLLSCTCKAIDFLRRSAEFCINT